MSDSVSIVNLGFTKSIFRCMDKSVKVNLFMKSTQNVFVRSLFSGFGGNMGCRGNPVDRKYYDLLEIKVDATTDEIKQAFRKQAMKHHPDKGGNIEKVWFIIEYHM